MKQITFLFIVMFALLSTQIFGQFVLDPNEFVNGQILGDTSATGDRLNTVYQVERNNIYFFDGRLDVDFPLEIIGPPIASGAIVKDDAAGFPPTLANVPNNDGAAQQFIRVYEGGYLVMNNLIVSGSASNATVTRVMVENTSGSKFIFDNVAFTDWEDFCVRNRNTECDISITNCVFLNGVRLRYSQWGGMVMRCDANGNTSIIENNTIVNASRLFANAGPFLNTEMSVQHNTIIHQQKNAHELRQKSFIAANNIYYDWEFAGYGYAQIDGDDYYQRHFTTGQEFQGFGVEGGLDAVSCYLGQNLFFRPTEIVDAYAALDSFFQAGYWEFASSDSFFTMDNNFKAGTNYEGFDPGFTTPVGNDQAVADWATELNTPEADRPAEMTDYRVPSPLTYDANTGAPSVSWPPAFDLSYSNTYLQAAGSDGLPLGDLNWFPTEKATYLANRDMYVAALIDSQSNAQAIYVPGSYTVDWKGEMVPDNPTPMITPDMVGVEVMDAGIPERYSLGVNYPNPFNPTTKINFSVPEKSFVSLKIYNVLGEVVTEIVNKNVAAGSYSVDFNAEGLSSGIYIYNINATGANGSNFIQSKKMTLLK